VNKSHASVNDKNILKNGRTELMDQAPTTFINHQTNTVNIINIYNTPQPSPPTSPLSQHTPANSPQLSANSSPQITHTTSQQNQQFPFQQQLDIQSQTVFQQQQSQQQQNQQPSQQQQVQPSQQSGALSTPQIQQIGQAFVQSYVNEFQWNNRPKIHYYFDQNAELEFGGELVQGNSNICSKLLSLGNVQTTVSGFEAAPTGVGALGIVVVGTMMDERLQVVSFRKLILTGPCDFVYVFLESLCFFSQFL